MHSNEEHLQLKYKSDGLNETNIVVAENVGHSKSRVRRCGVVEGVEHGPGYTCTHIDTHG